MIDEEEIENDMMIGGGEMIDEENENDMMIGGGEMIENEEVIEEVDLDVSIS